MYRGKGGIKTGIFSIASLDSLERLLVRASGGLKAFLPKCVFRLCKPSKVGLWSKGLTFAVN